MAGLPFYLRMPKVLGVELRGKLQPFVASKDVILEMLRRRSVKGGVGYVYEYIGPGASTLEVTDRATITNMGAEAGATTSIFASDEKTRRYLRAQGREDDFRLVAPDRGAEYDERIVIDLDQLGPLVAKPHMPGQRRPDRRSGRAAGGPGRHRLVHQLLVPGSDGDGEDPEGEDGPPEGQRRL